MSFQRVHVHSGEQGDGLILYFTFIIIQMQGSRSLGTLFFPQRHLQASLCIHFSLFLIFSSFCESQGLPSLPLCTITEVCRNECFVYSKHCCVYMRQGSVCLTWIPTSRHTIAVHKDRSHGGRVQPC